MILDNSKFTQDTAWSIEAQIGQRFFEQARPTDLLALYVISDQPEAIEFSRSREEKIERIRELSKNRPAHKKERRRIYDALHAALELFGQPRFADSILYLGGGIDHESSTSPGKSSQALSDSGVRIFGVVLKGLYQGKAAPPIQYFPSKQTAIDVMELALQGGGAFEYQETMDPQKEFDPTPSNLEAVWQKVMRSYWRIILTYRLDLSALPRTKFANMQLALDPQAGNGNGIPDLLYPHRASCP